MLKWPKEIEIKFVVLSSTLKTPLALILKLGENLNLILVRGQQIPQTLVNFIKKNRPSVSQTQISQGV